MKAGEFTQDGGYLLEDDRVAALAELTREMKTVRTHAVNRGWEVGVTRRTVLTPAGVQLSGLLMAFGHAGQRVMVCEWRRVEDGEWTATGWPQRYDGGPRLYATVALLKKWLSAHAPEPVEVKPRARRLRIELCPYCQQGVEITAGKWISHEMVTPYGKVRQCNSSGQPVSRIKPLQVPSI